jgi:hypothetical protein
MEKVIDIKKAKIIDGAHMELEYTEVEPDGDASVSNEIKGLFRKRVHPDLVAAYDKLKIHLAYLSEIVPVELGEDIEGSDFHMDPKFIKFKVTSFSIGGEGDSLGVTVTGQMKLRGKKILNLNTPFTKFEAQSSDNYEYLHNLYSHVMTCIDEVQKYISGKCHPNTQMEMFVNGPEGELKEVLQDFKDKGMTISVSDDGENFTKIN